MRTRRRTLLITAGAAVASLGVGLFAGSRMESPADAAAKTAPPKASDITVPVEKRTLKSQVVTRADASYAGSVDLKIEAGGGEGASQPIVTGRVPAVGSEIKTGQVVLEVTGRPVLALVGALPMYRSLRPGMSGPDVQQLEKLLDQLGRDPGTVDKKYTAATGRAVAELFRRAGYEPPAPDEQTKGAVDAAKQTVRGAQESVNGARSTLRMAEKGPTEGEKVQAQNAVDQAKRALSAAKKTGNAAAIADAEDALRLAKAQLRDLLKPKDVSSERAAYNSAREALEEAQDALDEAEEAAGTPLPASEVVFVPSLPRRVDKVTAKVGQAVGDSLMSVSGATLVLTANVDAETRALLKVGMKATLGLGDEDLPATISSIKEAESSDNGDGDEGEGDEGDGDEGDGEASGFDVVLKPGKLMPTQVELLRQANVKVTIPVNSTKGDVLVVPVAALSARPDGGSRVQVKRADGTTEELRVSVGLAADGYAEIRPLSGNSGALKEGDLVVVGR